MRFERLQTAIQLNIDRDATAYSALCMIEDLLQDVEEASKQAGNDRLPAGSEKLGTKLAVLCRKLNRIYEDNIASGDLQRNREMAKNLLDDLRSKEEEMDAFSESEGALKEAQDALNKAQAKLAQAQADDRERQRILAQTVEVQKNIESLQGIDPADLQSQLEQLKQRLVTEESSVAEQRNALNGAREDLQKKQQENESLKLVLTKLQNDYSGLETNNAGLKADIEGLKRLISNKQSQHAALCQDLENHKEILRQTQDDFIAKTQEKSTMDATIRSEMDRLRDLTEEINHTRAKRDESRRTADQLEHELLPRSRDELKREKERFDRLTKEQSDANDDLARLKANMLTLENDTDVVRALRLRKQWEERIQELDALKKELPKLETSVQMLQSDIEEKQKSERQFKEMEQDLKSKQRELSYYSDPAFQREFQRLHSRSAFIQNALERQGEAIRTINQTLGFELIAGNQVGTNLVKQLNEWLNTFQNHLSEVAEQFDLREK